MLGIVRLLTVPPVYAGACLSDSQLVPCPLNPSEWMSAHLGKPLKASLIPDREWDKASGEWKENRAAYSEQLERKCEKSTFSPDEGKRLWERTLNIIQRYLTNRRKLCSTTDCTHLQRPLYNCEVAHKMGEKLWGTLPACPPELKEPPAPQKRRRNVQRDPE